MRSVFAIVLFVCSSTVRADVWNLVQADPKNSVFHIFREINKVYRPSGDESRMSAFVIQFSKDAEARFWKSGQITHEKDAAGNVLIRVPGTGRFAQSTEPTVGLQAHLDMVLNAVDQEALEGMKTGVETEETSGWLYSKGKRTTLGADNGMGVAIALRPLVDSNLEHPPLELIFTVAEETTFAGAKNLDFPLKSKVIINLDSENDSMLCHGCQGFRDTLFEGELLNEPADPDARFLKVRIEGLRGGHSGVDIYQNPINAGIATAKLLSPLLEKNPEVRLVSLKLGSRGTLGTIPSQAEIVLAFPSRQTRPIKRQLRETFSALLQLHPIENPRVARLEFDRLEGKGNSLVITRETSLGITKTLLHLRDGVITTDQRMPNGTHTSSSVSFVSLSAEEKAAKISVTTRSFETRALRDLSAENAALLELHWPGPSKAQVANHQSPWFVEPNNWLFNLALSLAPETSASVTQGSLEAAAISERYPHIEMISIGPNIERPHGPEERVEIESVRRVTGRLDNLVREVGLSPHFCANALGKIGKIR